MEPSQIDLDAIDSLDGFYQYLETKAILLGNEHILTEAILKFKRKIVDAEDIQKLQWETEVSLFSFLGDEIFSFSSSNGKSVGEISQFPDLVNYQKEAFEYIENRAKSSGSSLLKARYYHILWKGLSIKHRNHAIAAADNYLQTIYTCANTKKSESTYSSLIGSLYENLVGIVDKVKVKAEETKKLTSFLLFDLSNLPFHTKHGIIDDMLKNPKIFKPNDFENIPTIFEQIIYKTEATRDDFMIAHYYLPSAIKVAQKISADVKMYYNEIGFAHIRMAGFNEDEKNSWTNMEHYRCAIEAFINAGNAEKKKETEKLYFELKSKVKLDEYRIDFDNETIEEIKKIQEEIKQSALNLLKEKPNTIYSLLSKNYYFPKYKDVKKASGNKKNHFLDASTTLVFDINKNISRKKPGTNEREEMLKTYGMRVKETLLPFLHHTFIQGIKSGHLTYLNFISFLIQHTWIGKPIVKTDLGGHPVTTNWINQILPSIVEFFIQVLAGCESKYYVPGFILCTDSLTLKIEGLFRSFSEQLNIPTSVGKKKGIQEVLLHDVIHNEIIQKYFDEEDLLLFDYVFSNEGGLNLRNNIAHSFYSENEYHLDKMFLLLAVLLRLGKYEIN